MPGFLKSLEITTWCSWFDLSRGTLYSYDRRTLVRAASARFMEYPTYLHFVKLVKASSFLSFLLSSMLGGETNTSKGYSFIIGHLKSAPFQIHKLQTVATLPFLPTSRQKEGKSIFESYLVQVLSPSQMDSQVVARSRKLNPCIGWPNELASFHANAMKVVKKQKQKHFKPINFVPRGQNPVFHWLIGC